METGDGLMRGSWVRMDAFLIDGAIIKYVSLAAMSATAFHLESSWSSRMEGANSHGGSTNVRSRGI
jgi:hypothetical protein